VFDAFFIPLWRKNTPIPTENGCTFAAGFKLQPLKNYKSKQTMQNKLFRMLLLLLTMLITVGSTDAAKKVHTLGDSTMAPYDESATNTRGWGMYFGNFLSNGWTSVNYARGGRDSRGGYNELWQNAKNNVEAGDYVLIQFAHNDGKYNGMDNLELQAYYTAQGDAKNAAAVKSDGRGTTPSTTYKQCLKQIIDAVKEKGATPILVSAVCRCYFGSDNKITRPGRHDLGNKYDAIVEGVLRTSLSVGEDNHTYDYSYQMKQLATEENIDFIDMTTATKELYESYKTYDKCYAALFDKGAETDNTHYNLTGAMTAARLCAQLMKQQGILADNIEIPTDLSITPSAVDLGEGYLGKTAVKELTLTGLGLEPASGTVTVTATEGIVLSTDKQNWSSSLTIDYQNGSVIKTFYAKVNLTVVGQYNGTVTAAQGDKSVNVPVTIKVVELGGGDPFTVSWTMNSTDKEKATVTGNATAADVKYEGLGTYGYVNGFGALIAPNGSTGEWPSAGIDDSPNQYVQFAITAPEGKKLDINSIAMKIKAQGGGALQCHAYYSTDGFVTRKTIFSSAVLTGTWNEITSEDVVKVEEGEQLLIRVYPWSGQVDKGRWICISDVAVSGQSKDAAGVNITGSIFYKLDKGGLSQNDDDAVVAPNELGVGFAGKKWAYDGTNEKVVVEGTMFYGASGNTKMMQLKYTGATNETLSTVADDDCTISLTLTPEDGFSFVPSKVSFLAGKFNSGNPHLTFAVEAGDTKQILKNNVELNRNNTNPLVDPSSFSEELDGFTATADNPLKLKFSFLNVQGTRSAGIANLVIEGQLVGAAAQVTKYVLNTLVEPAEAGSISREPNLEQYKENSKVILKATRNFGYKFKEWQDATGAQVSTEAETTVTMDAEKTMKAVFEKVNVYKVSTKVTNDADREGLGSITLRPNDHSGQYEEGTKITATANESKIVKFLSWTDENENASAAKERELTVNSDMELVANYEVQDFIAVFDASKTSAYATQAYPFAADEVWDANRNAKVAVVKQSDGSQVKGTNATPVVRNRANSGVLNTLSGVFQNGYNTAEIAWQYQFSTVGFTSAIFTADMAAKNAATKNWKAQYSVDGTTFTDLGEPWEVTANTLTPLSFTLPAEAIGKETVFVRIMGTGDVLLSDKYKFDAGTSEEGLKYATNSEAQVGNVYILGDAVVVADETAPVVTNIIPADNAIGVSATGKITITFDERIESANSNGAVTLGDKTLQPEWSSRSVSFNYSQLDYGTPYTFQMPANYVQDKSGNKYAEAVVINFTTMQRPTVTKALYDFIVPDNGTITEALNAANSRSDKNTRYRVFIKNGNYIFDTNGTTEGGDGKSYPDPRSHLTAANTSFIGESMEGVVITNITPEATWNNGFGTACPLEGIGKGDVLIIDAGATNSYFQNLTLKSSMGDAHGRDIVLHDYSTHTILKDACIWAYQDTYVSNNQSGAYYFEGGVVRGRTDFICGSGDAFFNKVDIIMCEQGGYVVAPQGNSKYGYVFKDCTLKGATPEVDGTYYLGRAWTAAAETYFINTRMEARPAAAGWHEWNNGPTRFAEYNSTSVSGSAIDLSNRATTINGTPNKPELTAEEAVEIGDMSNTFGDWQPTLLTEQAPVPTGLQANGSVLTWTGSDYALLYAIVKDGEVIAFTTEPTYTATENGEYAVRAANEMGGLSAVSAAISVSTTGITNNKRETINNNRYYDLQGRKVAQPSKGLYIVNGKKVAIK